MSRDFGSSHKDGEKPAEVSVNFSPVTQEVVEKSISVDLMRHGLPSLARLGEGLTQGNFGAGLRLNSPLSVDQLEMVEAELRNQGLLSTRGTDSSALSHQVSHEINMLKWRARRLGIWNERCRFLVHLPSYVGTRAKRLMELLSSDSDVSTAEFFPHRSVAEISSRVLNELHYLNDFASYLVGESGESRNRYERGLDLVLKVLADRDEADKTQMEPRASSEVVVILPIVPKDFLSILRNSPKGA